MGTNRLAVTWPSGQLRSRLTLEEGAKADAVNLLVLHRIWNLWKARIAPALGK
jgi:hypothetical protein